MGRRRRNARANRVYPRDFAPRTLEAPYNLHLWVEKAFRDRVQSRGKFEGRSAAVLYRTFLKLGEAVYDQILAGLEEEQAVQVLTQAVKSGEYVAS